MTETGIWETYALSYRAREMAQLGRWITAGDSGSIVGLTGCGRSHLLGFLCHRPDALAQYLPANGRQPVLVPVDLYNLPDNDLSSLYRTILHAFYWKRDEMAAPLQNTISDLYLENRCHQDPFLPQMALYELLRLFQSLRTRIVLVFNRFDRFGDRADARLLNSLRGLRDAFRDTLLYFVGMPSGTAYLKDPDALGDLNELLVGHVCWVGAMSRSDAHDMLAGHLAASTRHDTVLAPDNEQLAMILRLSGRFPSLLKALAYWWYAHEDVPDDPAAWAPHLLQESSIRFRLKRIFNGLSQTEQMVLSELSTLSLTGAEPDRTRIAAFVAQAEPDLKQLLAKGICRPDGASWQIASPVLSGYVAEQGGQVRGGIWLDEKTRTIYQGQRPLRDFPNLQYEILRFLIKNPHVKHTNDVIIDNAWPEEDQREGIMPNTLQAQISGLRKRIELNPSQPRFILTWLGKPGGYQFFPEGKPL